MSFRQRSAKLVGFRHQIQYSQYGELCDYVCPLHICSYGAGTSDDGSTVVDSLLVDEKATSMPYNSSPWVAVYLPIEVSGLEEYGEARESTLYPV